MLYSGFLKILAILWKHSSKFEKNKQAGLNIDLLTVVLVTQGIGVKTLVRVLQIFVLL